MSTRLMMQRGVRYDCRHFHQLFRPLLLRDLGHCDNLFGGQSVQPLHEFHQLVPHLRHTQIENLHEGTDVDDVLHGAPLDPLLRPPRLHQTGRPQPRHRHALIVQREELCACGDCGQRRLLSPWRSSALVLVVVVCPRGAPCEWCSTVARTMRTVCCSCLSIERSRRCLRRIATPPAEGRTLGSAIMLVTQKTHVDTNLSEPCCCCVCVVCCVLSPAPDPPPLPPQPWTPRSFVVSSLKMFSQHTWTFCETLAAEGGPSGPENSPGPPPPGPLPPGPLPNHTPTYPNPPWWKIGGRTSWTIFF